MRSSEQGGAGLKLLGGVVGVVLTVVLISSVFFTFHFKGGLHLSPRFSLHSFWSQLPHHLPWFAFFLLTAASVIPLRAVQWQATLRQKVPYRERYHLVAIGALVHNVVPGKLGDVFRAFLMSKSQRLPFVEVLGSVVVCKLLELASLMLLVAASLLGPFRALAPQFSGGLRVALFACVGCFGVVLGLAHYAEAMVAALERKNAWPKVQRFLTNVGRGLGTARSLRGLAWALLLSLGPVLSPSLGYGVGLAGLGIPKGIYAGAVMLGGITLLQTAGVIPVGMGIYYFTTSWTARALGASPEEAATYALLTHLGTVLSQVAMGAISMSVRKFRWSDLRASSSAAKAEALDAAHEAREWAEEH